MGELRNEYEILVGKHEGKEPLGKPRRRWEDNTKMYRREIVWEFVDWMRLAQNTDHWLAVVITVMNIPVP
jgi:hypothetical protein